MMSFKCCLVIRTIAGTLDNCFNIFCNFVNEIPKILHLLLISNIIILVWTGYGFNVSVKTIDGSLKYQYLVQWAFKSTFCYAITGYGLKHLLCRHHQM